MAVFESSDECFQKDIIDNKGISLVDFWAEWCGPCKMIAPILDELSKEFEGNVKIAKINVDHNRLTASQYGVRSIPTLILFKDGKPLSTKVGALSKSGLSQWLKDALNS
jgi:thioredoxin 1